jgi:radical SAM superfamily enzyme YgiQ (UPF0313 family)
MPYPVYPLGMSVVAAALKRAGHETVLYDLLVDGASTEAWRQTLHRERPRLVGVSIRNVDNVNLLNEKRFVTNLGQLVRCVHEELGVPVVLGGSGYSLMPEAILRLAGADYGIAGEGESLILRLVESLERGEAPPPNTIFRSDQQIMGNGLCGAFYDPVILKSYLRSGTIAPVQTKRGCRLRCGYCSYPVLEGGALRCRPASDVADDVQHLIKDHGVSYVFFTDSLFNDDDGAYLDVLREMRRRKLRVPWSAFLKPTGITEETVALMRETGLAAAELGSDAATDTTLRHLHKPFRFEDVVNANKLLMKHQIAVANYFMFGGPGETRETIVQGIDNIRGLKCSAVFAFLGIRILPHTELHRIAIRENMIAPDCDLLESVYYLSPKIDRGWAEQTLKEGFSKLSHVVFPPDAMDQRLQLLLKWGYVGSLWDMLAPS